MDMVAYWIDRRERVLAAVDAGEETQAQIAKQFLVWSRWIRKLIALREETGAIGLKPNPRGPKPLIQGEPVQTLRATIDEGRPAGWQTPCRVVGPHQEAETDETPPSAPLSRHDRSSAMRTHPSHHAERSRAEKNAVHRTHMQFQ
jgi:hypothetical protein